MEIIHKIKSPQKIKAHKLTQAKPIKAYYLKW